MKAIFLDFDGVLNTYESLSKSVHLDSKHVLLLSNLVESINDDVVIVLTTDWKLYHTLVELKKALKFTGLVSHNGHSLVSFDITPHIHDGDRRVRGHEIDEWLLESGQCVDGYVIIDDETSDMYEHQEPFIIKTDMATGFTEVELAKAKEIF